MKIAVISTPVFQLRPPIGTIGYSGLEVLAYQQAAGLAKLGHSVLLVAPDGSQCPGCQVIEIGPAGMVSEEMAWSGFPEIKNGWQVVRPAHPGYWQALAGVDVCIDNSWTKFSYNLKAEGALKCPVLGVCHAPVNTMFKELPKGVDKPCFVCISEDQRQHFEALFNKPARTAYNGIDIDYYKPLNIPRSNRYLFLARFSSIKGPDLAIQACIQANVGLDLVGDCTITNEPELLAHCQQLAANYNSTLSADQYKDKCIRLVGNATRGECVWYFSQAHCLLHPNERFREPYGLSPVESMACDTPVAAWDNGAMRETIVNGQTGFLVNSLDEMVNLIKSDAVASIDRNRCRERASQFTVDRMVRRYAELCEEAVRTSGW